MDIEQVVMVGPRQVRLERDRLPDEPPGPHEVVVRTRYSLISPGTELAHYAGTSDLAHIPVPPYPWYPGYAAVGDVVAAGAEARVRQGDLVLAHTPHQSAARFDARERVCVRVPDNVDPRLVTLARLGQVGAVGLRTSAARAGDWVAVIGLGLVGACAAQLARVAGMQVAGVDTSPARRTLAERYGVPVVADPRHQESLDAAVTRSGAGCRLVLECSGRPEGVRTALALAARRGEVALVGASWTREADVPATDILRPVFDKYLTIRGGWEWGLPLYGTDPPGSIAGCTEWAVACIRDGGLRAADLVTAVVAPARAADAYKEMLDAPEEHMAVIIDWTRRG